jgi:arginine deiminase
MDRIRTQARDMAQAASGKAFNADYARQERDRLREHIQTMQQEHQRLMQGLTADQSETVRDRARTMEQLHERIQIRLQAMNEELGKAAPEGKRVAEQARSIEREMKTWQDQHRAMGRDLALR